MKNGPQYFKYSVIGICVLAILFFVDRRCSPKKVEENPTVVETKTIERVRDSIVYVPMPYKVVQEKIEYAHLPMANVPSITDTAGILRDYFASRYYKDTRKVKGGEVTIFDTVAANRIVGRSLTTNIEKEIITKTVTLAVPKRSIGYFTMGAFGNQNSIVYGTEAGLAIKNKSDRIYKVGAVLTRGGDLYYEAEVMIPIRFRRARN
jgi:hypothetical protein